jgi:cell pole-organizing protein PopZ
MTQSLALDSSLNYQVTKSSTDEILKEIRDRLKKKNDLQSRNQNQSESESSSSKVIQYPFLGQKNNKNNETRQISNNNQVNNFNQNSESEVVDDKESEDELENKALSSAYKRFGDTKVSDDVNKLKNVNEKRQNNQSVKINYKDGFAADTVKDLGILNNDTYENISKRLDDAIAHFDAVAHHKVESIDANKDYSEYKDSWQFRSGFTMEDLAIEAMLPMVKKWIDENLESIVTDIVEQEIKLMFEKRSQFKNQSGN